MTFLHASPLPALKAAIEGHRHSGSSSNSGDCTVHTLHTFGGCTYTLTCTAAKTSPPPSSLSSKDTTKQYTSRAEERSGASEGQRDVAICFYHALAFADLDAYGNCLEELTAQLSAVAPHCRCTMAPTPPPQTPSTTNTSTQSGVSLTLPAGLEDSEREAALAWAAALRVTAALPALQGLLEASRDSGERRARWLLPCAAEPRGACHALHLCATPAPSSVDDVPTSASSAAVSTTRPFEGSLTITTCITSDDDDEAVLLHRFLDAFADAATPATHTLLLVHKSPQPPPEIELPAHTSPLLLLLPTARFVWWCTLVVGPHQMQLPRVLEMVLERSLLLRPTLLFHVHGEKQARHALLRQQLAMYAALFY